MIGIERAAEIDDSEQHREENNDDQRKFDEGASLLRSKARRGVLAVCNALKIGHVLWGLHHFHIRIVVVRETVIGDGMPGYVKSAVKLPPAVTWSDTTSRLGAGQLPVVQSMDVGSTVPLLSHWHTYALVMVRSQVFAPWKSWQAAPVIPVESAAAKWSRAPYAAPALAAFPTSIAFVA
jgi:hypothetical protein